MTVNVFPLCGASQSGIAQMVQVPSMPLVHNCGATSHIPSAERMQDARGAVAVLQECSRKTTQRL